MGESELDISKSNLGTAFGTYASSALTDVGVGYVGRV